MFLFHKQMLGLILKYWIEKHGGALGGSGSELVLMVAPLSLSAPSVYVSQRDGSRFQNSISMQTKEEDCFLLFNATRFAVIGYKQIHTNINGCILTYY